MYCYIKQYNYICTVVIMQHLILSLMANFIYVLRSGCLNKTKQEFQLSNTYFTSYKKAKQWRDDALRINRAENVRDSFSMLFDGMLEAIEYEGEGNKYTARIIIEKVKIL